MRRVLMAGGRLFLTIPFCPYRERNKRRAEIIDGQLRHQHTERYHGNPLSESGSLVFTDFGWELLGQMRQAGFSPAELMIFWSYQSGHMGVPEMFFHAVK